ncbi:hypothetical protein ACLOJK_029829 [Asimina triloba]
MTSKKVGRPTPSGEAEAERLAPPQREGGSPSRNSPDHIATTGLPVLSFFRGDVADDDLIELAYCSRRMEVELAGELMISYSLDVSGHVAFGE